MSVASSYGLTVKSSIFTIPSIRYAAGGQYNLGIMNPINDPANSNFLLVRNDAAYIDTSFPPGTYGGVTAYNSFKVVQDGIYQMSVELNNDYTGTALTVCAVMVLLYFYQDGIWKVAYLQQRTYPQAVNTNSINGSVIIDTTVLGSKQFCWNIQPYTMDFTTAANAQTTQFAQVTLLSPL